MRNQQIQSFVFSVQVFLVLSIFVTWSTVVSENFKAIQPIYVYNAFSEETALTPSFQI